MPVTYKTVAQTLSYIYFYDSSLATYSSNRAGQAAHDLFADDADVNDCLYFGATRKFVDLTFTIGTALAAASITVAWEFYNAYARTWDALPGLTDNTNAFQASGTRTLLFQSPRLWAPGYTVFRPAGLSVDYYWIRCRITAISGLTEGGANATTAISGLKAALVVTGTYSDLLPSLYTADVAGGWGVFERYPMPDGVGYEYGLSVPLVLGDGSTGTTVTITKRVLHMMDGALISDTANTAATVSDLVMILHWCTPNDQSGGNGLSLTYSTLTRVVAIGHWEDFGGFGEPGITHYGTTANGVMVMRHQAARWTEDTYSIGAHLHGTTRDAFLYGGSRGGVRISGDADRIVSQYGVDILGGTTVNVVHNLVVTTADVQAYGNNNINPATIYENPSCGGDVGNPALYEVYSASINNIYVTYYFRLLVVDVTGTPIPDVTVTISNAANNLNYGFNYTTGAVLSGPFTTDSNGMVGPVMLVRYKHWVASRTGNWKHCDTTLAHNPHTVTLTKTGYKTRTLQYVMDQRRDEVEMLEVDAGGGGGGPVVGSRIVRGLGAV